MRILYVENHPRFSAIAAGQFLAAHAVTVVPSLQRARAALAGEEFDLVLLDYDLDDGKGTELVAELVQEHARPLVIAASSHAAGNDALLRAGADAICAKLEFAGIEAVIARLLDERAGAR